MDILIDWPLLVVFYVFWFWSLLAEASLTNIENQWTLYRCIMLQKIVNHFNWSFEKFVAQCWIEEVIWRLTKNSVLYGLAILMDFCVTRAPRNVLNIVLAYQQKHIINKGLVLAYQLIVNKNYVPSNVKVHGALVFFFLKTAVGSATFHLIDQK